MNLIQSGASVVAATGPGVVAILGLARKTTAYTKRLVIGTGLYERSYRTI